MTTRAPDLTGAVLVRGDAVLPDAVLPDAVVVLRGDRISWVGPASGLPHHVLPPPARGTWLLPGLVDLHCHGGGGAGFPGASDVVAVRRAADEHLRHGTTTLVGSLVTAPPDELLRAVRVLADAADAGVLAGIHVEGPFLASRRCGAQSAADLRPGDAGLVGDLAAAARGHLVSMTVAPEVAGVADGGDDVLRALVDAGALPSVGHTDASSDQVGAALARADELLRARPGTRGGTATVTHLFNGMPPLHHRDPGPVAACLGAAAQGRLVVELVADGVHLAPGTVATVLALLGPHRVALVSDAIAAAGLGDTDLDLGPVPVQVRDGVARVAPGTPGGGALAGGTSHLLDVVRVTVAGGVGLVDAVRAAATTPAEVLGRADVGALEAGRRGDLVVTTHDLRPLRVARAGEWVV